MVFYGSKVSLWEMDEIYVILEVCMTKEKSTNKILFLFFAFMALFIINFFVPVFAGINKTNQMWLLFDLYSLSISAFLLIKNKLPNKIYIAISLLFGILMFVAYQGLNLSSINGFFITTLCSLASFSVFSNYKKDSVLLIKAKNLKAVLSSLFIGLIVGAILGTINLFLDDQTLNFNLTITCFSTALSPAILEEVCYRLVVFACCLYFLNGEIRNKSENRWCYFMMVVPHVLIHTPEIFVNYGFISGLISTILLSFIFGLPFAILQRKRDLASAMVAHGVVDIIRFAFLGLPF